MPKKEKMVRISIRLPEDLYLQVKKMAKDLGISMSELIRQAITEYLRKNPVI